MTVLITGAPLSGAQLRNSFDCKAVKTDVRQLQMRIAKSISEEIDRWVVKYRLSEGLSCMMENYHVQFLGS